MVRMAPTPVSPALALMALVFSLAAACGGSANKAGTSPAAMGGAGGDATGGAGGDATGGASGGDAGVAGSAGADAAADRPAGDARAGGPPRAGDAGVAPDLGPFMAMPCASMGTELCEDFETGQIDKARWATFRSGAAAVTVDGEHVHSGTYALHLKVVPGSTLRAGVSTKAPFPAKDDTFYARIFIYLTPGLPVPMGGSVHQGLIETSGKNADGRTVTNELGFESAQRLLGNARYSAFNGDAFSEYPKLSPASTPVPGNEWLCLEMMSDGHTTGLVRHVWWNGKEVAQLAENRTMPAAPPAWDQVLIGLQQYHPIAVLSDAWIDDIRISSQPIGCDH